MPVLIPFTGSTPLVDVSLEVGHYLLKLSAPGHRVTHYPISLSAARPRWLTTPLGGAARAIVLPPAGEISDDEAYVPAGWFQAGGDDAAINALPERAWWWAEGFVIRRDPITVKEYQIFIDDLQRRGLTEDAEKFSPTPQGHRAADLPVVGVDWACAVAYCAWLAAKTGKPWRLPIEMEWGKAARGTDARYYPWGDIFDSARCKMLSTDPRHFGLVPAHAMPDDVSPYGVRGLAGNSSDWCADAYRYEGPLRPPFVEKITPEVSLYPENPRRVYRGGAWQYDENLCRSARRGLNFPSYRGPHLGIRPVRSWPLDVE